MHPQLKSFLYLLLGAATVLVTLFAAGVFKAHAECLPSAQAVWAAHRGAHPTWSLRHGEKCWYARTGRKVMPVEVGPKSAKPAISKPHDTRAVAGDGATQIPLPRPAMRTGVGLSPVGPPSTPRGLVAVEHDQFRTWSAYSISIPPELLFLSDRMISVGWRLWLQASVEKSQDVQARLPPLR